VLILKGQTRGFGNIDTADLKLTECDFEKDANAMVLFNTCTVHYTFGSMLIEHHKRLKIFNSRANELGDLSIEFANNSEIESIKDLKAETINLNQGKIEITKLDKKAIYKQKVDKWISRYTFSFPSIKAGSVLEYSYSEQLNYTYSMPDWNFQGKLPVRYSEFKITVPNGYTFKPQLHVSQELVINTDTLLAMSNIHSLSKEPYMDSYTDNLQSASFVFTSDDGSGKKYNKSATWPELGGELIFKPNYGQQLKIKLKGEDKIIEQTKSRSPEEKIAFIFKKVKDTMTCYDNDNVYMTQTINDAWIRKRGNATEINMILCRLLTQAGIITCPLAVSMNVDKRIDLKDVRLKKFDRTVGYININGKNYVLDASEKDNYWYRIPFDLLNTFGLYMNVETPSAGLIFIEDNMPAKDIVLVNAEIIPDGKMFGTTEISSFSYDKVDKLLLYEKLGEKKYKELLCENNNDLKIDSIQFKNKEKDTIPLIQNISFKLNLPSSDEKYIYFNPNLFTLLRKNPFLSENRYSSVDFIYRRFYSINGRYKIPRGYKTDAIPKNVNLLMPDKSISFRRIAAEDDGFIIIHYVIKYDKSFFLKEEYPALREFYKKMYDMLNEQIILKKG
jgi:hypothetical protein